MNADATLGTGLYGKTNRAFYAFNVLTNAFSSASWEPRPETIVTLDGGPVIYAAWHAYAWASARMFREVSASARPVMMAHDGWASKINQRTGVPWGLEIFVFRRRSPESPRDQIVRFMSDTGRSILLFPDSGNPLWVVKPGIVEIAQRARARVLPFAIAARGAFHAGRARRHLIALPGCSLTAIVGDAIAPTEVSQVRCQQALDEVERQARARSTWR